MEKIKIGVIGVGHLGSLHAKMFSTIDSFSHFAFQHVLHN